MASKITHHLGKKIAATLIDYTLIYAFSFWFVFAFGTENEHGGYELSGIGALVPTMVWLLYFVIAERYCAATLGHELMKLRVVSIDGRSLSFSQVLKRRVCDVIEISWCFGLVAFFISENNDLHQRLGDILAKTVVIGKNESYEPIKKAFDLI
jgi:uncharacterized RDD family membrane protein YckC